MTGPRQLPLREFKQIIRRRRLCPGRPPASPLHCPLAAPLASCPPSASPNSSAPTEQTLKLAFFSPACRRTPTRRRTHTRPYQTCRSLPAPAPAPAPASSLKPSRSSLCSGPGSVSFAPTLGRQRVQLQSTVSPFVLRPHHLGRPSGRAWTLRAGAFSCVVPSTDFNLNLVTRHCATADPYTVTQPKLLVFQLLHAQSATSYD
jgi:hypothetical protein